MFDRMVGHVTMRLHRLACVHLPLLGLVAASVVGCASAEGEDIGSGSDALVGGRALALTEVRRAGLVALLTEVRNGRPGICSGVLVADDLVLTAGHCLAHPKGRLVAAAFGVNALDGSAQTVAVIDYLRGSADIALVRLAAAAPPTWSRSAVATSVRAPIVNAASTVMGFGREASADPTSVGRAQSLDGRAQWVQPGMPIVPFYPAAARSGACFGDSGGPLVVRSLVVGVLSNGNPSCTGGDTYTSIPNAARWLRDAAGAWGRSLDEAAL